MNLLPSKNERDAFDGALPTNLDGGTEQNPGELSLSSTHTQSWPFLEAANQLGAKVVKFAIKPITEYEFTKPAISKKVLAAMAGDPDPAASLADIRKLLVGPTRNLHDAMFEEIVNILEESDREIESSLLSLDSRCLELSHTTNELVSASIEDRDQNRTQIANLQKELQRSAMALQEMLSEMFLVIDSKIEELTEKVEADMHEAAANRARNMQELEAKCLAGSEEATKLLESRLAQLERRANREKDDLRKVFADGLSSLADRLSA
jgi:hypothetical protein